MTINKRLLPTRLLAVPALAVIGGLASPSPAAADAPTLACGTVVTTDVRLTADLVDCPGSGLVIGASGVTINLAGHIIDGIGSGAGIDNEAGHDDVRIMNGEVREFLFGIHLFQTNGGRVDRVAVRANVDGLIVHQSEAVEISRVTSAGNSFTGIEITFSDGVSVRRSAAVDNGFGGIVDRFNDGSRHEQNTLSGNQAPGLTLDRSTRAVLARNHVVGNQSDGIELVGAEDAILRGNEVFANAGHGISMDSPGNTVTRNRTANNGGLGIAAPDGTIDGGHNKASGNVAGGCTGVTCR